MAVVVAAALALSFEIVLLGDDLLFSKASLYALNWVLVGLITACAAGGLLYQQRLTLVRLFCLHTPYTSLTLGDSIAAIHPRYWYLPLSIGYRPLSKWDEWNVNGIAILFGSEFES
jgi:hypothetical protein